jgi:nitrate/nitrite-specific signal transduction histidine kinase
MPYGVDRMQRLAKELDASLDLTSKPGQGTKLLVSLTLKEANDEA